LFQFAKTLQHIHTTFQIDIADLNWARTQGWRDLIASTFDTQERMGLLQEISSLQVIYNSREPPFFCHSRAQSIYLLAWFASRLGWHLKKSEKDKFQFDQKKSQEKSQEKRQVDAS